MANREDRYEDLSLTEKIMDSSIVNTIKRKSQEISDNSNDLLEEFDEDGNEFYVDEVKRRKIDKREQKQVKKKNEKVAKRKPISPTQRKVRAIISTVIIVGVILGVCIILSLTVLFKTQAFEVTGNTKYTAEEIEDASGIMQGENIFIASNGLAAGRIKRKFPYVEDVDVGCKVPDTITIKITEAVESYLVKISDDEYLIISSSGRILDKTDSSKTHDLPIFIGPEALSTDIGGYIKYEDDGILDTIKEISTVFADNGYQGITEIDASNPANLHFTYDNRIVVKLGVPEDLSYKIRTAMTIIDEKIDVNKANPTSGSLDVSRCNETKKSYFSEEGLLSFDSTEETENVESSEGDEFGDTLQDILKEDNTEATNEYGEVVEETKEKLDPAQWYLN